MRVEAVDKTRLSSLRVAVVQKIVGRRLFVKYERMEDDEGFWFHEKSPMIHPVGWARMTGHELLSTEEYAKNSLSKALNNKFGPKDASWTLLPPIVVHEEVGTPGFVWHVCTEIVSFCLALLVIMRAGVGLIGLIRVSPTNL